MIYVFLAEGFEEIEALTPVDMLRRAGLDVKTVAVGDSNTVIGAHGIPVVADMNEKEYCDCNPSVIILPGGMPGTTNLENSAVVSVALIEAASRGSLICAICAAPSILGITGLLKGRRATCFPGFEEYLDGAIVVDERVVRDGNVITSKGMGCAAEFSHAIIDAILGNDKANEVIKSAFINV